MGVEHAADVAAARRRADALLSKSDFVAARAVLEEALHGSEDGQLLSWRAAACRALGDVAAAVDALERAYRWSVDREDHAGAGVAACTLADLELTHSGASAVASGWLGRGRHHLGVVPDHPGLVYLEGVCAYHAMAY